MKYIKHFSFDLWFTLIKSNPAFKKERALFFHTHFNSRKKSLEEVEHTFRSVDYMCNAINEKTGKNIDAEEMYLMVIYQLNDTLSIEGIDMNSLHAEMVKLLFKYSPTIFDTHTKTSLDRLKQRPDITLNILSNTGFVKGSTLRIILDELQISSYFDFQIYSDEVGYSKPNSDMFLLLLEKIYSTRQNEKINLTDIVHIGDNLIADIHGAENIGIKAFQINTNDKLITHIFS